VTACGASLGQKIPPPELPLFGGRSIALEAISAKDATVLSVPQGPGAVLRVATGHKEQWPGITLPAPGGRWDLSPYAELVVSLKNAESNALSVFCRVDNPGADGTDHCVTGELRLEGAQSGKLHLELKRASSDTMEGKLFGMRGYPVRMGGPGTIAPSNVTELVIFVSKPSTDHLFDVGDVVASGRWTPPTAWTTDATPFFPFIDTFGQYLHKQWPGKTVSLADLAAKRAAEASDLTAQPGPADWDKYGEGGWQMVAGGPRGAAVLFARH
jgi:hypothetical protein